MNNVLIISTMTTPIGDLTIVTSKEHVLICEFTDHDDRVAKQLGRFYNGATIKKSAPPNSITTSIHAYLSGHTDALNTIKTKPMGTEYEQKIWERLREIPAGTTTNYGAIASELNSSARAVGRANGRNPIALIHPCHRVIGADGSLTGYAGGLNRKEWLLQHEGALLPL